LVGFIGSGDCGKRAGAIRTLIEAAKLNDLDLQAWLARLLVCIASHFAARFDQLLPPK
jgi:predicted amidophosphoribosyltransferase